jgi:cell division protein FtsI (penicillin-binding protein 3)
MNGVNTTGQGNTIGSATQEPHRSPSTSWRVAPPGRALMVKAVLLLFFLVVALRLTQIQVFEAPKYQEIARRQYEAKVILPALRGRMYDRNGKLLVSNTRLVSIAADPKNAGDQKVAVADRLVKVFGKSRDSYLAKFSTNGRRFVWLERHVRPEQAKRVDTREFDGVFEISEPQRLYHYDHAAGQLIGFTDIDNKGLSGLELQEDRYLRGTDGYVIMQRDGWGRVRPSVDFPRVEPANGNDLLLTIDVGYQTIAEEELRKGVERNKAESGLVVMMDPATGEILALANYPTFDPASSSKTDQSLLRNRAITDMFEPGSVFKVVTASAALEHDAVKPDQKFNAEHGKYIVPLPGGKVRQINDMHDFGVLTFQEAIEQSSNIVLAKISDLVGAEGLYTMARNYGFGTQSGIELPGEIGGELKKPSQWSGTTLNAMAYGYEVGVTPMQIVSAYAAVANKGVLMKPFVVKQVLDENQQVIRETYPEAVRRVISKKTAEMLTDMFEGVVLRGTGVSAQVVGVDIAGKTGTSRKFIGGKYERGNYTATFAGFFPAEDPKVVCLVMMDGPSVGGYTGGLASAPVFKAIAEKVYATSQRFVRRPDAVVAGSEMLTVPDVTTLKVEVARAMLTECGFAVAISGGDGPVVVGQLPDAGTTLRRGARVTLTMDQAGSLLGKGLTLVPDVRRLPIRRAINRLAMRHLDTGVLGSGIVSSQSPSPGEQVKVGTRVTVRCEPRTAIGTVLY